jgi:hypothetical protein
MIRDRNGECLCLTVSPDNLESLPSTILSGLEHKQQQQIMATSLRHSIIEKYNSSHTTGEMIRQYTSLSRKLSKGLSR